MKKVALFLFLLAPGVAFAQAQPQQAMQQQLDTGMATVSRIVAGWSNQIASDQNAIAQAQARVVDLQRQITDLQAEIARLKAEPSK